MAAHNSLGTGAIHRLYDQEYADNTARDAATTWNGVSSNIGKTVWVTGTGELWMLTATTPTWTQLTVDEAAESINLYTADGDLSSTRTVNGFSGNDLTLNHYNGTASTYTLRSAITLEDDDITISAHLGDGFGADLASGSIAMRNTGLEIATGISGTDVLLNENDWTYYEGASDSTTSILTIHGDGDHSLFNPFVTLHEGFKTSNGTASQDLICNFGKAAKLQWNDGTSSTDVFYIRSETNGSNTFTHMETSFQGIRHDYLDISQHDWYFDSAGTRTWTVKDNGGTNVLTLAHTGAFYVEGPVGLNKATASVDLDIVGQSADCEVHLEASDSALYKSILNLESENAWHFESFHFISATTNQGQLEITNDTSSTTYMTFSDVDGTVNADVPLVFSDDARFPALTTTDDYWFFDVQADRLRLRYHDDSAGTNTNILVFDAADAEVSINNIVIAFAATTSNDQWEIDGQGTSDSFRWVYYDDSAGTTETRARLDPTGNLFVDGAVNVDSNSGTLVVPFASQVTGASTNITATTTEQTITLDTTEIDGSGSEYTIDLANNQIEFDAADGSKVYEVTMDANYLLTGQGTGGATRSYGSIKARLDAVDVAYSEMWCYIREWQGGTNGDPSNGRSTTFHVQPALDDVMDFRLIGVTDTGQTITDFELDEFRVTVKRVA